MAQRVYITSFAALLLLLAVAHALQAADKSEKANPSGTWKWKRELEGNTDASVLKLKVEKNKLSGTYTRGEFKSELKNGKIDGDKISFEVEGNANGFDIHARFEGTLEKDVIKGKIELAAGGESRELDWEAKRGLDYDDVVGKWQLRVETPDRVYEPVLVLALDKDKKPAGTYVTQEIGELKLEEISVKDADLHFQVSLERDDAKLVIAYTAKPAGDAMKGKVKVTFNENDFDVDFTGKRIVEPKKDKKADTQEKAAEESDEKPAEKN